MEIEYALWLSGSSFNVGEVADCPVDKSVSPTFSSHGPDYCSQSPKIQFSSHGQECRSWSQRIQSFSHGQECRSRRIQFSSHGQELPALSFFMDLHSMDPALLPSLFLLYFTSIVGASGSCSFEGGYCHQLNCTAFPSIPLATHLHSVIITHT